MSKQLIALHVFILIYEVRGVFSIPYIILPSLPFSLTLIICFGRDIYTNSSLIVILQFSLIYFSSSSFFKSSHLIIYFSVSGIFSFGRILFSSLNFFSISFIKIFSFSSNDNSSNVFESIRFKYFSTISSGI